ncbi:IS21 family transposase, partial [Motilimonas sp. 1_MG-2023]|nr:IS21 family transposase [Motilimonas sp. 1_MG-2023]
ASQIGDETSTLVAQLLQSKNHPEQSYRACLGVLNLSKKYPHDRVNAACSRALETGIKRVAGVRSILEKGLDKQPLPQAQPDRLAEIEHPNIRGKGYYH